MEDTTGFLPGKEQESRGIVQAGRAMLDAIIDLRTPRFLVLVRNAIGGAYASYNNYPTGADLVIALPTTRVAVMGSPGVEFVYKDELRGLRGSVNGKVKELSQQLVSEGAEETAALEQAKKEVTQWLTGEEAVLVKRYERGTHESEGSVKPRFYIANYDAFRFTAGIVGAHEVPP